MKKIKYLLNSFCLLSISFIGLKAQQSINTLGDKASGSGGTISYTVGQVFTNTVSDGSYILTEGVQQAYVISVVTQVANANRITLNAITYPNPTTDYLNLEVSNYEKEDLRYQLFDATGKLIKSDSVLNNTTTITMSNYIKGTYLFILIQGNNKVKSFKIIKN